MESWGRTGGQGLFLRLWKGGVPVAVRDASGGTSFRCGKAPPPGLARAA